MRAHYLQHVPFEGPGSIGPWLRSAGYDLTSTSLFESGVLPDVGDVDFLVVMGGPMSVDDEHVFHWLAGEKRFIRDFIETGKPVVGICLGAQLIAGVMGADVYRNSVKEIGWFPIQGITPDDGAGFGFPPSMTAFHWHGETFDVPSGATLQARSAGCENQAFQIGTSVIGLQFHLETTQESAQALVENCRDELIPARYVQTEEEILSVPPETFEGVNRMMGNILAYLLRSNA